MTRLPSADSASNHVVAKNQGTPESEFLIFLLNTWINNLGNAFVNAWRRVGDTISATNEDAQRLAAFLPTDILGQIASGFALAWAIIVHIFDILGILDTLVGDLFTSANEAMITTALNFLATPPKWLGNGVMTKQAVWKEMLNFILSTGYGIVSLHIPLPLKVFFIVKKWRALLGSIGSTEPAWKKILRFLERRVASAIKFSLVRAVFAVAQFWGCFLLVMLAYFFVDFARSGQILKGLSQAAPRLKVHPIEGGVIRRRQPGGSAP